MLRPFLTTRLDPAPPVHSSSAHPHAPAPPHPPPQAPHLPDPIHQTLTHHVVPRLLDRRQKAAQLAILVLLDSHHLHAPRRETIRQFTHAVLVGRDPGLHLVLEGPAPLHLLLYQGAAPGAKPLLRSPKLRRLVVRELQLLLHPLAEALLDHRAQLLGLGRIATH